jgi:mxaK protein
MSVPHAARDESVGGTARRLAEFRRRIARAWRESRSFLLAFGACALAAAAVFYAMQWQEARRLNATIERLEKGHDIEVAPNAAPELLLARISFLTQRDEIDQARIFVEALERRGDAGLRARGRYLLANALLRKTFDLIERGELDAAAPFVNLAKRDYRRALQLAPEFWDAKFNLDVASRLVRDYPKFQQERGDELLADPKKLWTDVPGKPKGLP